MQFKFAPTNCRVRPPRTASHRFVRTDALWCGQREACWPLSIDTPPETDCNDAIRDEDLGQDRARSGCRDCCRAALRGLYARGTARYCARCRGPAARRFRRLAGTAVALSSCLSYEARASLRHTHYAFLHLLIPQLPML